MSFPISATDLATARSSAESLMTQSVTIKRPGSGKTSTGAPDTSAVPTTIGTFACRRRDVDGDEQATADQLEPIKHTEFLLPHGTDVRSEDKLTIGSETWEVISVDLRSTLIQRRCLAKKNQA